MGSRSVPRVQQCYINPGKAKATNAFARTLRVNAIIN